MSNEEIYEKINDLEVYKYDIERETEQLINKINNRIEKLKKKIKI